MRTKKCKEKEFMICFSNIILKGVTLFRNSANHLLPIEFEIKWDLMQGVVIRIRYQPLKYLILETCLHKYSVYKYYTTNQSYIEFSCHEHKYMI